MLHNITCFTCYHIVSMMYRKASDIFAPYRMTYARQHVLYRSYFIFNSIVSSWLATCMWEIAANFFEVVVKAFKFNSILLSIY